MTNFLPIAGTISEPGEQVIYTFDGTLGQRLFLDALDDDFELRINLVSPSGSSIFNTLEGIDSEPFTLTESGTYQIIVDAQGDDTLSDFSFQLIDLSEAPTFNLGTSVVGVSNSELAETIFSFDGTAGQRLNLDLVNGSSLELYGPGNQRLTAVFSFSANTEVTLPSDGLYSLIIRNSGSELGYEFLVTEIPEMPIPNTGFGTVQSGTIDSTTPESTFTFDASAGTFVFFDSQDQDFDQVVYEFRDPDGELVPGFSVNSNASSDNGVRLLEKTGTYTITVRGFTPTSTGDYQFQLLSLQDNATGLTLGTAVSPTLDPNSSVQIYSFSGSVGQTIYFDSLDADNESVTAQLISPSNLSIFNQGASFGSDRNLLTLNETGTFYLLLKGNGSSSTETYDFSFQVLERDTNGTDLSFGTNISGTLAAEETQLYTFSGTAGERLFFDGIAGSPASWELYGPNQEFLGSNSLNGNFEEVLEVDGAYTLVVRNNVDNSVDFEFSVVTADVSSSSLTLGADIEGSIEEPGAQDIFTFDGTAGQILFYDGLQGTFLIDVEIISPTGNRVYSGNSNGDSSNTNDLIRLTETGTYQVILDGSGEETGDYSFRLFDVATQATPLVLDSPTPITGTLDPGVETQLLSFSGIAGQRIYFDSQSNSFSANWWLYDPFGDYISGAGAGLSGDFEVVLPSDGDYTLVLDGNNASAPIDYQIQVFNPQDSDPAIPLTLGADISGEISVPGERDIYSFSGTAGQMLYYDALIPGNFFVDAELLDPNGNRVFFINSNQDTGTFQNNLVRLPQTGTYQLVIDGSGVTTDSYRFRLIDVETDATPLTLDSETPIAGSIDPGLSSQFFSFAGTAGQRLYFDRETGSSAAWRLYDPSGDAVVSGNLAFDLETVLPIDGTYILVLDGSNASDPIDYSFQVLTSEESITPLMLGEDVASNISEPGERDVYTFSGSAGQILYYDALISGNASIDYEVLDPNGNRVFSGNSNSDSADGFTLPQLLEDGTYQLVVTGASGTTGDYSFRLSDVSTAPSLTPGSPQSGTLSPGLETDLFQFNGTAGQKLEFTSSTGFGIGSWWLWGPDGRWLNVGGNLGSDFEAVLPTDGLYTLTLDGSADVPNNSYSFQVNDISAAPVTPAGFGVVHSGTIDETNPEDEFTFTANAGTLLYFDSQDPGFDNVRYEIRFDDGSEDGLVVPGVNSNNRTDIDDGPDLLPESGTYIVRVFAGNATTSGDYQFQLLSLSDNSTGLTLGDTVSPTLTPNSETQIYSFAGTAGQRLYLDSLDDDGEPVTVRLISPTNQNIFSTSIGSGGDGSPVTLPIAGTYYVLVQGTGNSSTDVSDASFRLIDAGAAPAIDLDTDITGILDPGLESEVFTLTGNTGDRFFFDALSGGSGATLRIYSPTNQSLINRSLSSDFNYELPGDGTYLVILDGNSSAPVNYNFRVVTSGDVPFALTLGSNNNATIAEPGERHVYTFDATAGQRLFYDAIVNTPESVTFSVLSPNGVNVLGFSAQVDSDRGPITLDQTGTYQVVVQGSGDNTGAYGFRLSDITDPATAPVLTPNVSQTGELSESGLETDFYTITGNAGDRFFFNSINASSSSPDVRIYGPNNAIVAQSFNLNNSFQFDLPSDGSYLIAIDGANDSGAVTYEFDIQQPSDTTTPLTFGNPITGDIVIPGDRDIYTFEGTPGQILFYDALQDDSESINFEIIDPNGESVSFSRNTDRDQGPIVLEKAGTYQLIVSGSSNTTGDYNFRVLDAANATAITFDEMVSGTLSPGLESDFYAFDGVVGQRIFVDNQGVSSDFTSRWNLYLNGENIFDNFLFDTRGGQEVILPASGQYILRVQGQDNTAPIDYSFEVITPETTIEPLPTQSEIAFGAANFSLNEDGTAIAEVTVTRSGSIIGEVSAEIILTDGSATGGVLPNADFDSSNISVTFADGDAATKVISIPIEDDTLVEGDETFNLLLGNLVGPAIVGTQGTAIVTIIDNDFPSPGSLEFSSDTFSINEDGTNVISVTVVRSGGSDGEVTAEILLSDGTATSPTDFTATPIPVTFADGESGSQTITITRVINESIFEDDETINLTLANASGGATLGTQTTSVLTVLNDDPTPTASISNNPFITEGDAGSTDVNFNVFLSNPSEETITIEYSTNDGTATTADNDYLDNDGTLTFNPGETVKSVTVQVNGDDVTEGNESFSVNLNTATNANLAVNASQGTGTIIDDDQIPTVSISPSVRALNEGDADTTEFSFNVFLSNPTDEEVVVSYVTNDGSATVSDGDYIDNDGSITFAPGETSKNITVQVNGDTTLEGTEDFFVALTDASNATLSETQASSRGDILEDDVIPTISIFPATISRLEGDAGTQDYDFTVSLSNASDEVVTVPYTLNLDSVDASDIAGSSGTLTFNPGESLVQTITITINGDTEVEPDESFRITLGTPTNGTLNAVANEAIGEVLNDDQILNTLPQADDDSVTTNEDSTITINVLDGDVDADGTINPDSVSILSAPTNGEVMVNSDGTVDYMPDPDFNGSDSFTYTVADDDGAISNEATVNITVNPVNDVPVAVDDTLATDEDTAISIAAVDLLANDSDPDGNPLTVTSVDGTNTAGTVTLNGANVIYDPDGQFDTLGVGETATDTFTYTVNDGNGGFATATATVTVNGVNDAPFAEDDFESTDPETGSIIIDVLGNDSDIDGDVLSLDSFDEFSEAGSIERADNGTSEDLTDDFLVYTPDEGFTGTDLFTYTISDGNGETAVGTVEIEVAPPPAATASLFTPTGDGSISVEVDAFGAFGSNATDDAFYDPVGAIDTAGTTYESGVAIRIGDSGQRTFLTAFDIQGSGNQPSPDFTSTSDTEAGSSFRFSDLDFDLLQIVEETFDSDDQRTGSRLTQTYTITNLGAEAISFELLRYLDGDLDFDGSLLDGGGRIIRGGQEILFETDSAGEPETSTTFVGITAEGGTIPVSGRYEIEQFSALADNIIAGLDLDDDILGDGPDADEFVDADSAFDVTLAFRNIFDLAPGDSATYTTQTIFGSGAPEDVPNQVPVAVDDTYTVDEDSVLVVDVASGLISNDNDPDDDPLMTNVVTGPSNGTLTLNADGSFDYTPDSNFNGTDSFTYTVNDGTIDSNEATVTITVNPVNDSPEADDDTFTVDEGGTLNIAVPGILAGDIDIDGDSLSAVLVDGPTNGMLTLNPDGSFNYIHDGSETISDSFTYRANDGSENSNLATVNIGITPVNDAPIASNDSDSTNEGEAVIINVLANDTDAEDDVLIVSMVSDPNNGSVVNNNDGTVTYTPNAGFSGPDTFTYDVSDGNGGTDTATVTVNVSDVNDAPVATDDSFSVDEDTFLVGNVLTNDNDSDGDTLSVTLLTDVSNGSLVLNADGAFDYTPDVDFNGSDSFTYEISDGEFTDTATVNITVNPINDIPVASDDVFDADEDTTLSGNVLTNDSDVDNDPLTVSLVTDVSNGTLTLNADGSFDYTPDADFSGTDSFAYEISDGNGGTATATVNITVNPINDDPIATDDTVGTNEATPIEISVLDNDTDIDGDTVTLTNVGQPSNGTAIDNGDGTVTYTPEPGFSGTDTFTYDVTDGNGGTDTATVTVNVNDVNDAPTAADDSFTTDEDMALTGNVLVNDSDPDGDTLTVTVLTDVSNGSLTLDPDGSFDYTPDANFNGVDGFTYEVTDGELSSTATVNITVNPVNDVPIANDDSATTTENTAVTIDVLANDEDIDGDALSLIGIGQAANGTAVTNTDGTISYTPNPGFSGLDSFTYDVTDGEVTETGTVNITVSDVNNAPSIADQSFNIDENSNGSVGTVLATDPDAGDTLTYAIAGGNENGIFSIDASTGEIAVADATQLDFETTPTFDLTVAVTDSGNLTSSATITVNLNDVNEAPTAVDQDFSVDENNVTGDIVGTVLADDPDAGDTLTFAIASGNANGAFEIDPDTGEIAIADITQIDFSTSSTVELTVSVTDSEGLNDTAIVAITVEDEPTARVLDGLQVLYTFDAGSGDTVFDRSGVGTALDLTIADLNNVVWGDDGTLTVENALITSGQSATKLFNAITATNEITIEAWITPDNLNQDGPARIATLSSNTRNRNFTLGQDADAYSGRLRTTATNNNGLRPSVTSPDGTADAELSHVIYTREADGDVRIYVDNELVANATIGGDFSDWNANYEFALANELTGDRPWAGTYDLVAVYNQAFDDAEVAQNFIAGPDNSAQNLVPSANDDQFTVSVNTTNISLDVLLNDVDRDGDALLLSLLSNPDNGSAFVNNNGTPTDLSDDFVSYTPNTNFTGIDQFVYQVDDGNGGVDSATATIAVVGESTRVQAGLQVLYTFDAGDGDTVFDTSGVGDPLNLTIDDLNLVDWGNGTLSVDAGALISSSGVATKLNQSISTSNEITIEAWITSENLTQAGPARIATLSSDIRNRNFTLGQNADEYDVRLRTTQTGNNGNRPSLSSDGLLTDELTHLVYTRDANGQAHLYVDNTLVASDEINGDLSNWNAEYAFALANELTGDRPWAGTFDLVAVYDQAFDAAEVTQNFNAGSGASNQNGILSNAAFNNAVIPLETNIFSQDDSTLI